MKRATVVVLTAASLAVVACVSMSGSETVTGLTPEIARDAHVEEIVLKHGDLKVTQSFDDLFRARVKAKLDTCAKGARPLRLEASVHSFERTNPMITTIIAGRNRIRGEAHLIDIASGKEIAVYHIGHTVVGGKLGILAMGPAETQLSDAFGTELCNQAFAEPKAAGS